MKTLTLFRAYDATGPEIAFLVGEVRFAISPEETEQIRKKKSRKLRQKRAFRNALAKRLQEQEKKLAKLKGLQIAANRLDTSLPGMLDFLETPYMPHATIIKDIRHHYKEFQEALDKHAEKE